jgi:hypothetical protein
VTGSSTPPADGAPDVIAVAEALDATLVITAGPQDIDIAALRSLLAAGGVDPDLVSEDLVTTLQGQTDDVLERLANNPALVARFVSEPLATAAEMGVQGIGMLPSVPSPPASPGRVVVDSERFDAAVSSLLQRTLSQVGTDSELGILVRSDPIAAVIAAGADESSSPRVVAEAVRRIAASGVGALAAEQVEGLASILQRTSRVAE